MAANAQTHSAEVDARFERVEANLERASRWLVELRETQERNARELRETERILREEGAETDRRLRRAENLFTTQWGKLMESLVKGDLIRLLKERGIEVEGTAKETEKSRNGEHFEIDILAINGSEIVAVEVKTTLRSEGVTRFPGKLERFLEWWPDFRGRRIYGAVAYLQADESVVRYAERRGLFVIRATGNSASIVNPDDFKPRNFS